LGRFVFPGPEDGAGRYHGVLGQMSAYIEGMTGVITARAEKYTEMAENTTGTLANLAADVAGFDLEGLGDSLLAELENRLLQERRP
jgi:hypothetical protein